MARPWPIESLIPLGSSVDMVRVLVRARAEFAFEGGIVFCLFGCNRVGPAVLQKPDCSLLLLLLLCVILEVPGPEKLKMKVFGSGVGPDDLQLS